MNIDLSDLSPAEVYFTLIQTVIPRPIAWVLSENANGTHNLAPFSYFNAVCANPPLLMISVGRKPDGSFKDTRVNIEQRHDFVIHIVHLSLLEAMNQSAATFPADVSEVQQLGLTLTDFAGSRLPRLADCRVAYACECYQIQDIGPTPQALILGRVREVYIDDAICSRDAKGRLKVHADRLDPVGRLGGGEYVTFGEIRHLVRPN
ncbi:MAG: flavin reductase family protein [Acidiferrobacterales bacterium]|nr:flavin reductase family protein [Acidiferrobacterales bacterium]